MSFTIPNEYWDLYQQEIAKVAPEGHSSYDDKDNTLWCPWAYKYVHVAPEHHGWPVCNGCLRPVDIVTASNQRSIHSR